MGSGDRRVETGTNHGIISLGDDATNTIYNYNCPLPSASSTPWPGGPGRLSPVPVTAEYFVGREQELRDLHAIMRSGPGLIAQASPGLAESASQPSPTGTPTSTRPITPRSGGSPPIVRRRSRLAWRCWPRG
jgi:hypothetical protein